MSTNWLIQEFSHPTSNCSQIMINYLDSIGRKVVTFKYIPFGGTDYGFLDNLNEPAVFFGTWNALKDIRKNHIETPKPFVWLS